MKKNKPRSHRRRKNVIFYLFLMQTLAIIGSISVGTMMNSGSSGYLIGYILGIVISLSCAIGIS